MKSMEPKRSESGFSPSLSSKRELTEDWGAVRAVSGAGVVMVGSGGVMPSVLIPSPTGLAFGCGMVFGGVGSCCVCCFTSCITGIVGGLGIVGSGCVGRMGSVVCGFRGTEDCSFSMRGTIFVVLFGCSKGAETTGASLTIGSGILIGFSRAIRCAFFSL